MIAEAGRAVGIGRKVALAAFLAVAGAGCGLIGRESESPEEARARMAAEERIRREVAARLEHEPAIDADAVRVVVRRGGDVELHGGVRGFGALQCAIATAERVPGVALVIDFLVLHPGPREVECRVPRVLPAEADGGERRVGGVRPLRGR